jgi:hypothetical protein
VVKEDMMSDERDIQQATVVTIRITAASQEESDAARAFLHRVLGDRLTLAPGRPGRNPRYAGQPQVLAYGELEIPAPGQEPPPAPHTHG